jgi:hypothetical protein
MDHLTVFMIIFSTHGGGDIFSTHSGGDIFSTHSGGDIFSTHSGGDIFSTHSGGDIFSTHSGGDIFSTHSGGVNLARPFKAGCKISNHLVALATIEWSAQSSLTRRDSFGPLPGLERPG